MKKLYALLLVALPTVFILVSCALSWSAQETLDKAATRKSIPELRMPAVAIANFADVPPAKESLLKAKLKDSATTLDKAVNYKEVH